MKVNTRSERKGLKTEEEEREGEKTKESHGIIRLR
jgi:hypothetical protein